MTREQALKPRVDGRWTSQVGEGFADEDAGGGRNGLSLPGVPVAGIAGATVLNLAGHVGYAVQEEYWSDVHKVREYLGDDAGDSGVRIATTIGMAVANSMAAISAGVRAD